MTRATRPIMKLDAQGRPLPSSGDYLTFRGDYTGTDLIYAGFARTGAAEGDNVWQLYKCAYDASHNLTSIKWPEKSSISTSDFDFNWTGRAGYTYS